jgi:hypothetical protein
MGFNSRPHRSRWHLSLVRNPGRTIGGVVCVLVLAGIGANALFFQTARHPAPIFGTPVAKRIASPSQKSAPQVDIPIPPPRPVDFSGSQNQLARVAIEPAKDQIGGLLKTSIVNSPDTARTIQAAQRALILLGHPIKADGVMGVSTRQAIEKFEQARKLPVTGELTPRTLRELAAQTGALVQ